VNTNLQLSKTDCEIQTCCSWLL